MKSVFCLIPLVSLLSLSAFAETAPAAAPFASFEAYQGYVIKNSPYQATSYAWTTPEQAKKDRELLARIEKTRAPAGDNTPVADPSMMSSELTDFTKDFLKVDSADALDAFIDAQDAKYDSYKNADVKFVVAQLVPMKQWRGFIWRVIPVLERARAVHSLALTFFKKSAADLSVFLPTEQWKAGFDYITQPYATKDGVLANKFSSEAELQVFFSDAVLKSLETAANRINGLSFADGEKVWDNQMFYGTMSFQDGRDRYRRFGELERHLALASLHGAAYRIAFGRAFSNENAMEIAEKLGNLNGLDGFNMSILSSVDRMTGDDVKGVSAMDRYKNVLHKSKYANYGRRYDDYSLWLKDKAWSHLKEAVAQADLVWGAAKNRSPSEAYVFKASSAQADRRMNDARIENMKALMKDDDNSKNNVTTLPDHITGEAVRVNLHELFVNPPANLKDLLATHYTGESTKNDMTSKSIVLAGGKKIVVPYRDYFKGRPSAWNLPVYQKYFPDIKAQSDVQVTARVLSQSWGSWLVSLPLMAAID